MSQHCYDYQHHEFLLHLHKTLLDQVPHHHYHYQQHFHETLWDQNPHHCYHYQPCEFYHHLNGTF